MQAIHIDADGAVAAIDLPDHRGDQYAAVRTMLGGDADQAVYHRSALLWVHGDGQRQHLPANLVAWTLASAWRGVALPYQLFGDVVVTGRDSDGDSAPLTDRLAGQVRAVAGTVEETMTGWRMRPPISQDAAISQLLAYARNDVNG
ncbi:hypothetical protein [Streptacidiphilus sp. EB129]|uniref:DUF3846 domain-containing protein n=1 Tax=Streptacidiphilus sp. EB129 TaxID=3156262 RepID=UPI003513C736